MLWRADEYIQDQRAGHASEGLLCLIPAFQAVVTIGQLIHRIRISVPEAEILVVDDGSTDETAIVAQASGAEVVRHRTNMGKGAALQTGFGVALQKNWMRYVVTLDADLQHRPEEIPILQARMKTSGVDIVVGSRERWGSPMPLHRVLSNTITTALVRARTGLTITDSQCGFRLIKRRVLEHVRITSPGYEGETEFLLKAARLRFQANSVNVRTVYGTGASHMSHWHTTVRFIETLFAEY